MTTTSTTHENEQTATGTWISRENVAAMSRKDVKTIARDIAKHQLPTRPGKNGKIYVRAEDFVAIGRIKAEDLAASPTDTAQLHQIRRELDEARLMAAETRGRLSVLHDTNMALAAQLKAKDEQIAQLLTIATRIAA